MVSLRQNITLMNFKLTGTFLHGVFFSNHTRVWNTNILKLVCNDIIHKLLLHRSCGVWALKNQTRIQTSKWKFYFLSFDIIKGQRKVHNPSQFVRLFAQFFCSNIIFDIRIYTCRTSTNIYKYEQIFLEDHP